LGYYTLSSINHLCTSTIGNHWKESNQLLQQHTLLKFINELLYLYTHFTSTLHLHNELTHTDKHRSPLFSKQWRSWRLLIFGQCEWNLCTALPFTRNFAPSKYTIYAALLDWLGLVYFFIHSVTHVTFIVLRYYDRLGCQVTLGMVWVDYSLWRYKLG
jgi:hypothetical protein